MSKDNNREKKPAGEIDIEKYRDIEGITTKQLDFGLWIVEHKKQFRTGLIIFLIALAVFSWAYTLYGFGYYFIRGVDEDKLLVKDLLTTSAAGHDYVRQNSARDLVYYPVDVLPTSGNKYDFLAKITNPNTEHWGSFDYCFFSQGREIECGQNFILPAETKYVLSLAQELAYRPADARLVINNLSWQRINAHQYPDWQKFQAEHLNFEIKDIKFSPANASGLSEKLNLNSLTFAVRNHTPYNYWEVGFNIVLFSGNAVAGINRYTAAEFMSGEEKDIQLSWPGTVSRVTDVEIIPEINILREDIYIRYEGGSGEEK